MDFTIHDETTELVFIKNIIVPKNSTVRVGIDVVELPNNDSALMKQLFGPLKKKAVVHDDEEEVAVVRQESDSESEDSESEKTESEESEDSDE
jgi:Ran GTPase-activating protein (RanGAP) involved in mRNA processing and transport